MKLTEQIDIDAGPAEVWPWVADPARHGQWNDKVQDVSRAASGPATLGERFEMTYVMNDEPGDSRVDVVELQPGERVAFRHAVDDPRRRRIAIEQYELTRRGDGVRLTQTIDMSQVGIPWFLKPLIWLLHRFGTPQGTEPLVELKQLVELDRATRPEADPQ